jgi:hypothetical protein
VPSLAELEAGRFAISCVGSTGFTYDRYTNRGSEGPSMSQLIISGK